jgi:hypothetical protein
MASEVIMGGIVRRNWNTFYRLAVQVHLHTVMNPRQRRRAFTDRSPGWVTVVSMRRKRKAYVHVGMPGAGDVVEAALVHHQRALAELGIDVPARSSQEAFRAAVEILREHRVWGFERAEVEGQWAQLYRRAWKGRNPVVFSQSLLSRATPPQIDLLLAGLAGFEVHAVVTTPGEPGTDLGMVLDRWGAAVRRPERLHIVPVPCDPADPAAAEKAAWKGVGKTAGFGTASLGLADVPRPVAAHPRTLDDAVREIERLARRNECLEQRLEEADRKRRPNEAARRPRPGYAG